VKTFTTIFRLPSSGTIPGSFLTICELCGHCLNHCYVSIFHSRDLLTLWQVQPGGKKFENLFIRKQKMPKRARFDLNNEIFVGKEAVHKRMKEVLERSDGKIEIPEDHGFLVALLERHPEMKNIQGQGVDHFKVQKYHTSRSVFLVRKDGSEVPFSYGVCLHSFCPHSECQPYHRCQKALVLQAFRDEIKEQIETFRMANIKLRTCPLCEKKFNKKTNRIVVDHEEPQFIEIANDFLQITNSWERLQILGVGKERFELQDCCPYAVNDGHSLWIADRGLADQWKQFHDDKKKLRLLCSDCNLRRPKEKFCLQTVAESCQKSA
jgi:hypothetical protein